MKISFPKISFNPRVAFKKFGLAATTLAGTGATVSCYKQIKHGRSHYYNSLEDELFWQRLCVDYQKERNFVKKWIHQANVTCLESRGISMVAFGVLEISGYCFFNVTNRRSDDFVNFGIENLDISTDPEMFESPKNPLESTELKFPSLCKYGRDLTREISLGSHVSAFCGREKELADLGACLNQRLKSFPVLVGEPGVGKTALIYEAARKIVYKEFVPSAFENKRIFVLDGARLKANTTYSDTAEGRLMSIIEEVNRNNTNIIIFIDEVHEFFDNYSNIMKPYVNEGKIKFIGATTAKEYDQMIAKDHALKRRLPVIPCKEPTPADTLGMLKNLRSQLENKYLVDIHDDALIAAVNLADQHLRGSRFPDKAIDLIDQAASQCSSSLNIGLLVVREKQEAFIKAQGELQEMILKGIISESTEYKKATKAVEKCHEEYKRADERRISLLPTINKIFKKRKVIATYRKKLLGLLEGTEKAEIENKVKVLRVEVEKLQKDNNLEFSINRSIIESTASEVTGLPLDRLSGDAKIRLQGLNDRLKEKIINQDHVVDTLCKGMIRARLKLGNPNRPKGVFFFMGPTGVGKTELAKRLAEDLFGSKDAMIRFDMSEYHHSSDVSKLIGSPPGYKDNGEGGLLTNRLIEKPHSVVLLDEFEKADKGSANLLLQVFDDGRLTDGRGVTVNCQDAIFIMTSNLKGIGVETSPEQIVEKAFSPEFVNRLDEICRFNPISKEALVEICKLRLEEYKERVNRSNGITIKWDDKTFSYLVKNGWSEHYGARPLEKLIERELGNLISDALLRNELKENMVASFIFENGSIKLEVGN